ncbi:MAG: hypothetical protein IJP38_08555 [Oscillospiraceae bacterium]|nr:hypothetical protein [Oscillospiraceae bacterium]
MKTTKEYFVEIKKKKNKQINNNRKEGVKWRKVAPPSPDGRLRHSSKGISPLVL